MPARFSPARFCLFVCVLLAAWPGAACRAQELSYKEAREILLQAENTVAEYENLLNAISNTNSGPAEVQLFMEGSYTPGPNQIFLNKEVVVEDDIDPAHHSAADARDRSIATYLADFDISYAKTDNESVRFDQRKSGPIRRSDILFVNVLYRSQLKSASKSGGAYLPSQRVMTLRAERAAGKWHTYIAALRFARPADSSATPPADVVVIQKTAEQGKTKTGAAPTGKDVFAEVMQEEARREYAETRQQRDKAYADAMSQGDAALATEKFDEAAEAFTRAVSINSYDYRARARLQEVERSRDRKRETDKKQTEVLEQMLAEAVRVQDYEAGKRAAEQLLRRRPGEAALQDQLRTEELRLTELDQLRAQARLLDIEAAIKFWGQALSKAQKAKAAPAQQADLLVGRARSYTAKSDYKRALADLTKALEANPVHRPALLGMAQTHLKMQEPYKALSDYTQIITHSRFSPQYYKDRAAVKLLVRDTAGAVADFDQAIGLDNGIADLYYGRGLLLTARRKYPAAETDFSAAIRLEPEASRHYFRRGQARLAAGNLAGAAEDYASARAKNASPDEKQAMATQAWAAYELGAGLAAKGSFQPALARLNEALLLNPELVEAALEKGAVLVQMLDYGQAERCYTAALDGRATYTPLRVARSSVRLLLKNTDGAVQDCMAALAQEPLHYGANVALANVYMAQERLVDAQTQYKKAQVLSDEQPLAYLAQGRALSRAGQTDAAEKALERGLKYSDKAPAQPLADLADNALRALDYKAAISYADRSLKTGLFLPQAYLAKGRAEIGLGQTQQGLSDVMKVADKDPEQYHPLARIYSATAYGRMGQAPKARQELEKIAPARRELLGAVYQTALADCRLLQDSVEAARALYTQALAQEPGYALARYGLARCAAKSRQPDEALALLKESLKGRPLSKEEILADPSFAALQADKRFKAVLKEGY